jgi:hypothetical protein
MSGREGVVLRCCGAAAPKGSSTAPQHHNTPCIGAARSTPQHSAALDVSRHLANAAEVR